MQNGTYWYLIRHGDIETLPAGGCGMTIILKDHTCRNCKYFFEPDPEDAHIIGVCLSGDSRTPYEVDDIVEECKYWVSNEEGDE